MKRILVIGNNPSSLVNFRGLLLKAMVNEGNVVFAAAGKENKQISEKLQAMGIEYCPARITRTGMNPLSDLITLCSLVRLMHQLKPDVVLNYTVKPVVFGALAAKLCRVKEIYSIITGLGYVFTDAKSVRRFLAKLAVKFLYSLSLPLNRRVFFQNPDDRDLFVKAGLVKGDKAVVVNGSGVDLDFFSFVEINRAKSFSPPTFKFLLIARLLRDKGICEYVEAARIIKQKYSRVEFHLVGPYDSNPSGLNKDEVRRWKNEGLIKFHGEQADVRPFIEKCWVYVLPSYYREGVPRSVLEAMATGRAVITSDSPGCRETVNQLADKNAEGLKIGANGILVPIKNVEILVAAMEFFLKHPEQAEIMGKESRLYAQKRYDVHKVNKAILNQMGFGV